MSEPKLRLVTIAVSHYCEKARWALDRAGMRYVEEAHAPMFHWASTFRHGRQRTVPVLVTPHGAIGDSTAIMKHVDAFLEEPRRLFPHDAEELREVEALEQSFDAKLGPQSRRWAYAWACEDAEAFRRLISQGLRGLEARAVGAAHGAVRGAMRRAFALQHPEEVRERTMARVRAVFEEVSARLLARPLGSARSEGGARWLVGDRFSAADLTFAALSAPVILPSTYGAALPSLEEVPAAMARTIRELRATPAGELALRAYEIERPAGGARAASAPRARGAASS